MLKKAIILFFFLSSLVFLSGEGEKVLSNIDMSKLESIKILIEDEGVVNDWINKVISDFIQTAKAYDKHKKLENKLKNLIINVFTYPIVCLVLSSSYKIDEYMNNLGSKAEEAGKNMSPETIEKVDKMIKEIQSNLESIMSDNPNKKMIDQYLNLTSTSIDNYRKSK